MPLNENYEIISEETQTFLYVEKMGPFHKMAPLAWQEFWQIAKDKKSKFDMSLCSRMAGLSAVDATKSGDEAYIYQAGVFLKRKLDVIPEGLSQRSSPPGKYARFVLQGSYSQFADAYPRIFAILSARKVALRTEFCIEAYLNSPTDTAESDLLTEIIIPVQG